MIEETAKKMLKLTIDGKEAEVPEGTTVLQAARGLGIDIPTMCYLEGVRPQTSCLMCVVKVNGNPNLVPSCSRPAEDGMVVENNCDDVNDVRKTTLELLLSDHVGDCVAPCANTCPAHMEIPQMLRQVVAGDKLGALITVKRDIPFPGILGRVCPEICEGGCRRGTFDTFESICLVKRYVADEDLDSGDPYVPECEPDTGYKMAIVGSGIGGMSCAYYLREMGHQVTIFDCADEAGGALRYKVPEEECPNSLVDQELDGLRKMGVTFEMGKDIGVDLTLPQLQEEYDAVFLALGPVTQDMLQTLGVKGKDGKPTIKRDTLMTNIKGVFAGGGIVHQKQLAIRSVAAGKTAAKSMDQYVRGDKVVGRPKRFNSRSGKLTHDEVDTMMESVVNRQDRYEPQGSGTSFSPAEPRGFTDQEAVDESARCLHCDCRAKDNCDLRDFSEFYEAKQTRFTGRRRSIQTMNEGDYVHLDSGKCIQCGLCVQIAADQGEEIGLTFVGRGFDTKITAPFGKSLSEALKKSGADCAMACPTGALALRGEDPTTHNPYDLNEAPTLRGTSVIQNS